MSKLLSHLLRKKATIPLRVPVKWLHHPPFLPPFTGFMDQVERDCERVCPNPRIPPQKLTVVGAGSDVGRIVSLFMKQRRVVNTLCLYDNVPEHKVIGVGMDLSHMDTSPDVEAYQGRLNLQRALFDSDVVVICGGCCIQPPCFNTDEEIFCHNMSYVRSIVLACARFCPYAFIVLAVHPIDVNFAMVCHVLKKECKFNNKRVIGFNSLAAMRANSLMCSLTGEDPSKSHVSVVGGCGRCTSVPVFSSNKKTCYFPQQQIDCLVRLVRDADDIICKVKNNGQQAHLSMGFALARCTANIMSGLFEKPAFIDSALVWQDQPEKAYGLQICASSITVGRSGIVQFGIPTLNARERELLDQSVGDLKDRSDLGKSIAIGEEYVRRCCKPCPELPPCPQCKPTEKKVEN